MVVMAGVGTLLRLASGDEDVVIGFPISGRSGPAVEKIIGLFFNTLALRIDLSGSPTFGQALDRVRESVGNAFVHQDLPFERLVEELNPERDLGCHPIFQVFVDLQAESQTSGHLGEAILRGIPVESSPARFDLMFTFVDQDDDLDLRIEYSTDLFEPSSIDQMATRLQQLLMALLDDVERPITGDILLSPADRHHLLVELNQTAVPREPGTLVSRLGQQAVLRPDVAAVVCGGSSLSFGELDARSNQLTRHLENVGVRPGDRVGVFCDRSVDLVVTLFGIMKAGAAYVPVDPGYPADRVAFLLDDAQVSAVVTQSALVDRLPLPSVPVVRIDADWPQVAACSAASPDVAVEPDDLAYVIYTSGSTGRPKGVMVEHRGVVNLLDVMAERPGLEAGQVMVGLTTPAFDLSVPDLFLPLVTGATLVLASLAETRDPAELARLFEAVGADLVQATPATWRMLCESGWTGRRGMRVVCGGEGYGADLVQELLERVDEVWNFYGPTEATVWSVCTRLDGTVSDPVSMGRPIANTACYVLDKHRRPVPQGVPGELYLGGVGLARGYFGRPELTAERFVANPFGPPGTRLYATGDLVRYREDGTLVFLGRTDHQVKLRGFRIELGEIESALTAQEGIAQAVVIVREDNPGNRRLVAYVVGSGAPIEHTTLTEELRRLVPAYMVPSAIVTLDTFPLTPNGKLDRKALPEPERGQGGPEGSHDGIPPTGPLQIRLAGIFSDVLGVPSVCADDDFFHLGGTSLLAVKLFARIEAKLGTRLPLAVLFEIATVAHVAEHIEGKQAIQSTTSAATPHSEVVVPLRRGTGPALFLVHPNTGQVIVYRDLARQLPGDFSVYGIQAVGLDRRGTPSHDVHEMAARYVNEIRSIQPEGPYFLGGHCIGGLLALEIASQLELQGAEVGLLLASDVLPHSARSRQITFSERFLLLRRQLIEQRPGTPFLRTIARPLRRAITVRSKQKLGYLLDYSRSRLEPLDSQTWAKAIGRRRDYFWRKVSGGILSKGWVLPRRLDNVTRSTKRAFRRYPSSPIVNCRVLIVRADRGERSIEWAVQRWTPHTNGQIDTVLIRGVDVGHHSMIREPFVEQIAEPLAAVISELAHRGASVAETRGGAVNDGAVSR
jgi:amino acid adenylation domain-containing protein